MATVKIQSRIQSLTFILIVTLASGCFGTSSPLLGQQEGPPPDFQGTPPDGLPAVESVKKQLARMTHRYGLTSSQQETIRPILDAERRRTAELFADTSIPQGEKLARAKSIRGDASEKIAAVLTDAQRTKFEQDEARRDAREQQDGMDMEGPPPPPPDDSGPPPP
jgi:hypothetical protein